MNEMTKIRTKSPDFTATVISQMFHVSSRYVRMIRDKQRANVQILDAYLKLKGEIAEVIDKACKDHLTPDDSESKN